MIVKHIGADGRVRRTFENVNSIHQHQGNSVVSINRQIVYTGTSLEYAIDERPGMPPLKNTYWNGTEYPVVLINLAPGESVERVEDEPVRN